MKYCLFCGQSLADEARFCSGCGAAQPAAEQAPAPPQPDYPMAPAMQPPPPPAKPSGGLLGKTIAGMACSILGFFYAALGITYTSFYLFAGFVGGPETDLTMAAFIIGFSFSFFSFPSSIVGKLLSDKALQAGSTSCMAPLGRKFGILGLSLSAGMIPLALIGLLAYVTYWMI